MKPVYKVEWSAQYGFTSVERSDLSAGTLPLPEKLHSLTGNELQDHVVEYKPFLHSYHEEVDNDKVIFRTFYLSANNLAEATVLSEVLLSSHKLSLKDFIDE